MAKITTTDISNNDVNKEPATEAVTKTGKVWLVAYKARVS
jgi:hypothetical protein